LWRHFFIQWPFSPQLKHGEVGSWFHLCVLNVVHESKLANFFPLDCNLIMKLDFFVAKTLIVVWFAKHNLA
jgi:hypothetical protein